MSSKDGMSERKHWDFENRILGSSDKEWLSKRAAEHVTDSRKLAETREWLKRGKMSQKQAESLCKRWGITFDPRG